MRHPYARVGIGKTLAADNFRSEGNTRGRPSSTSPHGPPDFGCADPRDALGYSRALTAKASVESVVTTAKRPVFSCGVSNGNFDAVRLSKLLELLLGHFVKF